MRLNWTDEYLSWVPSQHGGMKLVNSYLSSGFPAFSLLDFSHLKMKYFFWAGLKQIHFGQSEIWKPDIQLYNNADSANMQVLVVVIIIIFIILVITIIKDL